MLGHILPHTLLLYYWIKSISVSSFLLIIKWVPSYECGHYKVMEEGILMQFYGILDQSTPIEQSLMTTPPDTLLIELLHPLIHPCTMQ